jgi:hypothetical protein
MGLLACWLAGFLSLIVVPSQHSMACRAMPLMPAMLSMLPEGAGLVAAQSL